MPRYIEDPETPEQRKERELMETIDRFIGKHITKLPPDEFEYHIVHQTDPQEAWADSSFKEDAKGMVRMAKIGSAFSSLLGGPSAYEVAVAYVTRDNMMKFFKYFAGKYPEHAKIVQRYAPGSYYYLESSTKALLQDLLA